MTLRRRPISAALAAAAAIACACAGRAAPADQNAPYLPPASIPDMTPVLPAPPAFGSPEQTADERVFAATRALKGSDRWSLATHDAALDGQTLADDFACALGVRLTPANAPAVFRIMARARFDVAAAYNRPKDHYVRPRPFLGNDLPVCTPRNSGLAANGSYPSGHTTIGESLALILAEIAPPDRAGAILARGRTFGESRIVCGVHWASDVEAGYLTAANIVAILHQNAAFRADLDAARGEIAHATGTPDAAQCRAESDAATHPVLFEGGSP